jgi:hypothetical protein
LGRSFGFITQLNQFAGAVSGLLPVIEGLAALFAVNQAGSLIGGLVRFADTLGGGSGVIAQLGRLGALGAAGGVGFGLGALADEVTRLSTGTGLSDRLSDWLTGFTDLNDQAERLTEATGGGADQAARDIAALDAQMGATNEEIRRGVDFWGEYGRESTESAGRAYGELFILDDVMTDITDSTNDATAAVGELAAETENISLEEKLAIIEANSAIATASIQADAQVLSSAFDSVGSSIETTGSLLGDLYGALGDENISKFDKLDIKQNIEEQNEALERQRDIQEDLARATLRELNARTRAFERGGSLIRIDGAGLQPHLEAFMFEILEAIQVRVNAQGFNLLLGVD